MTGSFTRTLRLKVRRDSYRWLEAAATEVNQVFNYCNEISVATARRTDTARKWLSGFDLCNLTAGATAYFEQIGADTIQRVCTEYALKRSTAQRLKLRWRVSHGARRSLGWVPFKAASLKCKGRGVRFCGKSFRVFERERLEGVKWQQGCFAQDAVGDWWLCLPAQREIEETIAPKESVGIDILRRMLQYKGEHAGRSVVVVDESYSSRVCSSCGAPFGPSGLRQLVIRTWRCALCGDWHDRDVNAARNIVRSGSRCWTSVCGNESLQEQHLLEPDIFVRARDGVVSTHALA